MELYGEASQVFRRWTQRGSRQKRKYDPLLRPVARHEQDNTQPACLTVEHLVYGDNSAHSALHNGCGQLIRHLDSAGSLQLRDYGLGAVVPHSEVAGSRHMLWCEPHSKLVSIA